MNSINRTTKPGVSLGRPPLQSGRLLDQMRERIRYLHYSLSTEQTYVYWARWFIRFHGLRHPKDMGQQEVERFLTMLANERKVSPSTHRQALSALLFLYQQVLGIELPWLQDIGRPIPHKRIPSVLTREEVQKVLDLIRGETGLLARLLYGTGMRHAEGLNLRVKDVDFDRHVIVVRNGKGGKDRAVMLPRSLVPALREQLAASYARCGLVTARLSVPVSTCPMRWIASIPARARPGPGTGSFPLR